MVDAESVENVPLPTAQRRADLVTSVLKVVDADNKFDTCAYNSKIYFRPMD
jgi:hypothetical protein